MGAIRVGKICDDFLAILTRKPGEDILDFDARFESALRETEHAVGILNPTLKAHLFLKKLKLPGDKESQVITGAMNKYQYEALRDSAAACITRVSILRGRETGDSGGSGGSGGFHSRHGNNNHHRKGQPRAHRAHATEHDDDSTNNAVDMTNNDGDNADDVAHHINQEDLATGDDDIPDEIHEAIVKHLAFITQAKKHRADMEKAWEFYRKPKTAGEDTKKRMISLKQRLPCARCGRTGHWKDDPEYPLKQSGGKAKEVHVVNVPSSTGGDDVDLLFVDTACAKSVAGARWANAIEQWCIEHFNTQLIYVNECEPFRFGPGDRIYSKRAIIVPCLWGDSVAPIRLSIVDKEVPPLIAKRVLKSSGSAST